MGREPKGKQRGAEKTAAREAGFRLKCIEAQELFYNIGEEKLNPEAARKLRAHEASCPDCCTAFRAWREVRSALREARVSPPPAFAAGVVARITEQGCRNSAASREARRAGWLRWDWAKGLAAAAVILALLTGSVSFAVKYWPAKAGNYIAERKENAVGKNASAPGKPAPRADETRGDTENPGTREQNPDSPGTATEESGSPQHPDAPRQMPAVKEPNKNPVVAANNPGKTEERKVFLNKTRIIKTTMLKVAVADLDSARDRSREIARSTGAEVSSELSAQSNGHRSIILRFTLAPERAERFLADLAALGEVSARDATTQDVTASFARALEEYQALKAQQAAAPESERARLESQINFLEQQLQNWDQEAGRQVVILWLEQ